MGGHLNAYTSREQKAYYARVFKNDLEKATEVIADILRNSKLADHLIEREREVILREKEEIDKQYEETIFDHLHAIAFPKSPLSMTILGTEQNIRSIAKADLRAYIASNYHPNRMVAAAAGAVDHEAFCELVNKYLGDMKPGPSLKSLGSAQFVGSDLRLRDDSSQLAHMVIAVQGASWTSPDYFPLLIAQAIVGSWNKALAANQGECTGRLAQVVSQNNLAQSFFSFNTSYSDTGLFGIYMVSDHLNDLDDLIYEVQQEWVRVCLHVGEAEVERAKTQLKAAFLMSLDGTTAICEDIGRQILSYGKRFDWREIHSLIDNVDAKTVRNVASEYLYDRCPAVVGMGAIGTMPDYNRIRAATLWSRN